MIMGYRPYIAREGWPYIFIILLAALVVNIMAGLIYAIPLWILSVVFIYIFRDPERTIPSTALAIVSPVDGDVESVRDIRDPYLERTATAIGMQMKYTGPYILRGPIEGKLIKQWQGRMEAGDEIVGANPVIEDQNNKGRRYLAIWVQSDEGDDVVLILMEGNIGFRPRCYVNTGERIGQGRRCGFISFGCRVMVIIPQGSRNDVTPGDAVIAGSGIIATLLHK